MAISRLRLQIAAWFALVFLMGLAGVDLALFNWLSRDADSALSSELSTAAEGMALAVGRELAEEWNLEESASEAIREWPPDSNSYVFFDSTGGILASTAPQRQARLVPTYERLPRGNRTWDVPLDDDGDLRLAVLRPVSSPAFTVIAMIPTTSLRAANERIALWLGLSAPLVVLLALIGGYLLASRALRPLGSMTRQLTTMDPGALDLRLPVRHPPDEVDELAVQFNHLFERLAAAQARNSRFLAQAAHQIRTPLTVIRGESSLGLERPRSVDEHLDVLRRVAMAAEQMTHRVEDLFLLAQAQAGDRPPIRDLVDIDGLVLECVDLMRGRATALGFRLELGTMDPVEIRGNEPLVREAVLELLENAFRHGDAAQAIRVSTVNGGTAARIDVASGGAEVPAAAIAGTDKEADATGGRLGLSIVRWIAGVHGGQLDYRRDGPLNTFALTLSTAPPPASTV